jgi:hypothetical protein
MTSQQKRFKAASSACRRSRVKPFSKAFGKCMRGKLGKGRRKKRRR